jgi:hypothetical protein
MRMRLRRAGEREQDDQTSEEIRHCGGDTTINCGATVACPSCHSGARAKRVNPESITTG